MLPLAPFIAWAGLLTLPVALLLGPLPIELCLGAVNAAFLVRVWYRREAIPFWFRLALVWWAWVLFCSLPGIAEAGTWPRWTVQALVGIRLPVFALAASHFLAEDEELRQRLAWVIAGVAAFIALQLLLQLAGGTNWLGQPMRDNGLLTGPFDRPRAGPTLMHLFFPLLLPAAAVLPGWAGTALLAGGVAVMVPIGQRMPLLLVGLGLILTAWLLPALRRAVLAAVLAGGVTLAAGALFFPNAQFRLVSHFLAQLGNFPESHYGLIYTRAAAIAAEHPWLGRGFAAFRTGCGEERYFVPSLNKAIPDGGGAGICVTHAHNFYLEATADAGLFGLMLFTLLTVTWLRALWPRPGPDHALRVGLFIAAVLHLWPLAGTNTFTNPYMSGWFFLFLGWGLALIRPPPPVRG